MSGLGVLNFLESKKIEKFVKRLIISAQQKHSSVNIPKYCSTTGQRSFSYRDSSNVTIWNEFKDHYMKYEVVSFEQYKNNLGLNSLFFI